jgi:hypothetical protein
MPSGADETELRRIVHRHRVTWETRPEIGVISGSATPVGHIVELMATPDHPAHSRSSERASDRPSQRASQPMGACPECAGVTDALERLARAVLPDDARSSYEIHSDRGRVQIDPAHDSRPELSTTITILHGDGANRQPEAPENGRRDEVLKRLRALGVPEKHWPDDTAP